VRHTPCVADMNCIEICVLGMEQEPARWARGGTRQNAGQMNGGRTGGESPRHYSLLPCRAGSMADGTVRACGAAVVSTDAGQMSRAATAGRWSATHHVWLDTTPLDVTGRSIAPGRRDKAVTVSTRGAGISTTPMPDCVGVTPLTGGISPMTAALRCPRRSLRAGPCGHAGDGQRVALMARGKDVSEARPAPA
jgi:hypothetical protein